MVTHRDGTQSDDRQVRIPKLIHRIWLDEGPDDVPMPDEFVGYGERWDELHPGWTRWDWTGRSDRLVPMVNRDLFETAREWAPDDWKRARSDILRLELLLFWGGVYVDCDVEPLRSLDPIIEGRHHVTDDRSMDPVVPGAFLGASPNQGAYTNAIIGAVPQHPLIRTAIERLPGDVETYSPHFPLHFRTGPWLLTRAATDWKQFLTAKVIAGEPTPGVTLFAPDVFYPVSIADRDSGERPSTLDTAYTDHHWANTRDDRKGGLA